MSARALSVSAVFLVAVVACSGSAGDDYVRGHNLQRATVSTSAEAQIVDASVHAAFDVEPSLILRMHPRRLPRTAVDTGTSPTPSALVNALRERGLVRGTCDPVRSAPRNTPQCGTPDAGYIIRTSDVLSLSKDTVEIYFSAEKYGPSKGAMPEALRLEKVYQLVKAGQGWRVVREGRLHER
jgi:hypothetical protein